MTDLQAEEASMAIAAKKRRQLHVLVVTLVLLIAVYFRVHAVLETRVPMPLQGDSTTYVSAAYNLRHFGVFSKQTTWDDPATASPVPDAFVAPGYPALLWTVTDGPPDRPFVLRVMLLQLLLGCATVALSYFLAIRVLPFTGAIAATLLVAISPHLIVLGTALLTETLYSTVIVGFLYLLVVAMQRRGIRWMIAAGLLLGLSALVRPTLQYLPIVLVPLIAWQLPHRGWKASFALLAGFLIAFGPWTVRNKLETGSLSDPALLTNALQQGAYPDFMYQGRPETKGFPYRFDPQAAQVNTPRKALERIAADFKADPLAMSRWYLTGKPIHFYDWAFLEGSGDIFINTTAKSPYFFRPEFVFTRWSMHAMHWLLIGLSLVGIAWSLIGLRSGADECARIFALLASVMAFVMLVHMIGFPLGRYSVPFRPLTFVFAMRAVNLAAQRWRQLRA